MKVLRWKRLTVVGVDDLWGTNFAPDSVLSSVDPATPTIVLSHNPDTLDLPIWNGYQGWVLSGHTRRASKTSFSAAAPHSLPKQTLHRWYFSF